MADTAKAWHVTIDRIAQGGLSQRYTFRSDKGILFDAVSDALVGNGLDEVDAGQFQITAVRS